jgi:calmodulin
MMTSRLVLLLLTSSLRTTTTTTTTDAFSSVAKRAGDCHHDAQHSLQLFQHRTSNDYLSTLSNREAQLPKFTTDYLGSLGKNQNSAAAQSTPPPASPPPQQSVPSTLTEQQQTQQQQQRQQQQLQQPQQELLVTDDSYHNNKDIQISPSGFYQIRNKEQHQDFIQKHADKLVIVKFKADYCRACKAVESKFAMIRNDPKLSSELPIVWAEVTASPTNKAFFRRLGVLSLPTVHFYDGTSLIENFSCGPAKIPTLKQKLSKFIQTRVDLSTNTLLPKKDASSLTTDARVTRQVLWNNELEGLITKEVLHYLRDGMPFFSELNDEEFDQLLSKAKLLTYDPGDTIIRQGMQPKSFFVIKSGVAEMCIRSKWEDPISTPPSYLGAVVNQLQQFDYFGERALTTGEPYAASVRALEKTRCIVFHAEDIPEASILSKKRRASQTFIDKLTERYELPADYTPPYPVTTKDESILELLVRFKQIRQAAKCFEYVMTNEPLLGDVGEIARRSMLVSKLSKSQQQDFVEVFNMADVSKTGTISLLEMRRFMASAQRKGTSDGELLEMIHKANQKDSQIDTRMTLDEFMGVMAEAEFYSLFTEIFQALDKDKTGYVRAGDLDEVLDGVRDLISNDRKSLIDVEDQDVQVCMCVMLWLACALGSFSH